MSIDAEKYFELLAALSARTHEGALAVIANLRKDNIFLRRTLSEMERRAGINPTDGRNYINLFHRDASNWWEIEDFLGFSGGTDGATVIRSIKDQRAAFESRPLIADHRAEADAILGGKKESFPNASDVAGDLDEFLSRKRAPKDLDPRIGIAQMLAVEILRVLLKRSDLSISEIVCLTAEHSATAASRIIDRLKTK